MSARMKLALFALLAFAFVGCTRTIATHRETFEPTRRTGPWAQAYRDALNRKDRNHPEKRALFREREYRVAF
jgi:hypothetical protein